MEKGAIPIDQILIDFPQVGLVYLFGSQVRGEIGPMSDYDLAILVDRSANLREIHARLMHAAAVRLGTELVDVVLLNEATIE